MARCMSGDRRDGTQRPRATIVVAAIARLVIQGKGTNLDGNAEVYFNAQQALYFDIRKGAHSIGSNVRDAAAYVIWALARAQDPSSLSPHAVNLAGSLVSVSLFDRDVSIRRAASAAFQEHVGRMVRHCYTSYLFKHSPSHRSLAGSGFVCSWYRRAPSNGLLLCEHTAQRVSHSGSTSS